MTQWYLDIETEGPDPRQGKVLAIEYQEVGPGGPMGTFQVLAEWEWGEKQILRSIIDKGLLEPTGDFVPVGDGLRSQIAFLMARAERLGIRRFSTEELHEFWLRKPMLDLAPVTGFMDPTPPAEGARGFAGQGQTSPVPTLYREGRHTEIIEHVTRKKDRTMSMIRELAPRLRESETRRPGSPSAPASSSAREDTPQES